MSIYDEFRGLAAELFVAFEAPNAVISRKVAAPRSPADRAQGKVTVTVQTFPAKALLGSRKVKNNDGTYREEAVARIDTEVLPDDGLTVGTKSFTVTTVTEINPDGTTAIIYVADLK